ncbi:hypothetical protein O181_083071 [Austropuccinia psidii MF-1]|uniref:Uncharacterized protein n=1 Tax=Austropuccinia psidii MF-1 TaxID=1389203 RepID=A0A9Q3IHJ7_9BASI|nr:hypothetical protein [Austropuccinia psidii MF-1]
MASSGHFDPTQTYYSYKAVELLDPACTKRFAKGTDCFENYNPRSPKCHYCFIGKKPCRRTGKQASNFRRYLCSKKDGPFGKEFPVSEAPTLDGASGYTDLTGSMQRDVARWTNVGGPIPVQSQIIPSTPRNFQPALASIPTSIPPSSPHSSHTRPTFNSEVRPSPIQQPKNSPIVTSQQLQPVATTSRRREELSPWPFSDAQVFQRRD